MPAFVSGHDLLSGIENAPSGTASFYSPGTLSPLVIFGDDTGTTASNPVTLDSNGRATVYLSQQARMIVQNTVGTAVVDTVINRGSAPLVSVDSDAFTDDTLDEVLDLAETKFGGVDWDYKPGTGSFAGRSPKDWMSAVHYDVMSFADPTAPTINDGATPADAAIASAIALAISNGGGVVYFPPGTYRVIGAIACTSAIGVSFRGAGAYASSISLDHGTANAFTFSLCESFCVAGLSIDNAATGTGACLALANCNNVVMYDIWTSGTMSKGVDISGATSQSTWVDKCRLSQHSGGTPRAVKYDDMSSGGVGHWITDSDLSASTAVEYAGVTERAVISNTMFAGTTGVLFTTGLTGTLFTIYGCQRLGAMTTPIDMTALTTNPILSQWGNQLDGYVVTQASGGGGGSSHTPTISKGTEIHVRLTSGGAAVCTLNAPTPAFSTSMRGATILFRLTAAAGGAITWTFPAIYVLIGGGTTIAGADGTTTMVAFNWDPQTSELRQLWPSSATAT